MALGSKDSKAILRTVPLPHIMNPLVLLKSFKSSFALPCCTKQILEDHPALSEGGK